MSIAEIKIIKEGEVDIYSISENKIAVIDNFGEKSIIEIKDTDKYRTVKLTDENNSLVGTFVVNKSTNTLYSTITGKTISLGSDENKGFMGMLRAALNLKDDEKKVSYSDIANAVGTGITIAGVAAVLAAAIYAPGLVDLASQISDAIGNSWTVISDKIAKKNSGGIKIVIGKKERKIYKQGKWHVIADPYLKSVSTY